MQSGTICTSQQAPRLHYPNLWDPAKAPKRPGAFGATQSDQATVVTKRHMIGKQRQIPPNDKVQKESERTAGEAWKKAFGRFKMFKCPIMW
jgi:hypothetical protein